MPKDVVGACDGRPASTKAGVDCPFSACANAIKIIGNITFGRCLQYVLIQIILFNYILFAFLL